MRFPIPTGSQTLARGRDPETSGKNESDPEGVVDELNDARDYMRFSTVMIFLIRSYLARPFRVLIILVGACPGVSLCSTPG